MRAGRKDRRIIIEVLTTAKSSFGSDTETWALYKTVWAEVTQVQASERFGAEQMTSERVLSFKIDYIPGISAKTHRIKYEGEVYDISPPQEVGRREAWLIAGTAQGV